MTRPVAVLRPEPGNAATARRIETAGLTAVRLPLFAIRALDWSAPDPARHDALVLTSANAVRHAGAKLHDHASLPVYVVGEATAATARAAGLNISGVAQGDLDSLLTLLAAEGINRALHLAGRDRVAHASGRIAAVREVYASEPLEIPPERLAPLAGGVALLHSPRAARRLAELADRHTLPRADIALAAFSPAVAAAAGAGWRAVESAPSPDDTALVALARRLAD